MKVTVPGRAVAVAVMVMVMVLTRNAGSSSSSSSSGDQPAAKQQQPCHMQYRESALTNKSIDFENPAVFELLASRYGRERSPFFELLHRERDCITLWYWINNEPPMDNFRGLLRFQCAAHELLRIELQHSRNGQAPGGYCLSMRLNGRPLEQYGCPELALRRSAPLILQARVGSMVQLSQESPDADGPDTSDSFLLFERVARSSNLSQTLRQLELEHPHIPPGAVATRGYFSTHHWMQCECDRIRQSVAPLHRCLGIVPDVATVERNLSEDVLVLSAIGVGCGVIVFLLLKLRTIC